VDPEQARPSYSGGLRRKSEQKEGKERDEESKKKYGAEIGELRK
jgi:hypothetical protein